MQINAFTLYAIEELQALYSILILLTTTKLIRGVPTVINMVTHLGATDALLIGTTELVKDARSRAVGTDSHVIFI